VRATRAVVAGTFFLDKGAYREVNRPYSVKEVLRALEVFNLKRNSVDHLPINKTFLRGLNLADFFYSRHARNGNGPGGGSLFLQCLEVGGATPAVDGMRALHIHVADDPNDGNPGQGPVFFNDDRCHVYHQALKFSKVGSISGNYASIFVFILVADSKTHLCRISCNAGLQ